MAKKAVDVQVYVYNKKVDLDNHKNNDSKPYYIVSTLNFSAALVLLTNLCRLNSKEWTATTILRPRSSKTQVRNLRSPQ